MGRYIVIIALLVGCGAIITIIANSYGQGADRMISELLAILLLLIAAMAAGFLAALGLRALRRMRDRSDSKGDK